MAWLVGDSFRLTLILMAVIGWLFMSSHSVSSLPSSQIMGLLQLQMVLENPPVLNGWYTWTDFCNLGPTPNLKILCAPDGKTLTGLRIVGDKPSPSVMPSYKNETDASRLSSTFSSRSLADALLLLPNLTVVELVSLGMWGPVPAKLSELNYLQVLNLSSNFFSGALPQNMMALISLEVLAIDNNLLNGFFPRWLGLLPNLTSLILSKNFLSGAIGSFNSSTFQRMKTLVLDNNLFNGSLPRELNTIRNVLTLVLAQNQFSGEIPDLSMLRKLQTLNLNGNSLGPNFPLLGNRLVNLQLAKNNLVGPIPDFLKTFTQLKVLDLSVNSLSGFPPLFLFTLPKITTMVLAENHFSGQFGPNLTLARTLVYLDLSSNFFTGQLPHVLISTTNGRYFVYQNNCFDVKVPKQQSQSYCLYESKLYSPQGEKRNVALIAGLAGGGLGIVLSMMSVVLLFIMGCPRFERSRAAHLVDYGASSQTGSSVAIPSELLSNARYLSQSMRLGILTLPHNQVFSLEQLEEATDNFSQASLIGEGIRGKVFKGRLEDGTHVAVKCCCFDPKLDSHDIQAQMELLSKLRHRNVASVIGYCFQESETDSKHDRRLFVVSEFVDNGNLRSHVRGGEESLSWLRRLAAVIGAAKGLHYLHHGVLSSIFHHDLKATNIMLDHNFVPKIVDFGLPRPPPHVIMQQGNHARRSHYRRRHADKMDVYKFGLVLLEMVMGRPPVIQKSVGEKPKIVELDRLMMEPSATMDLIDPFIVGECGGESLATVVDIAIKCLADDLGARPSMEDVLWNLQYAMQVQDTSLADVSEELVSHCSSSGSSELMKEYSLKSESGSFEKSVTYEKQVSQSVDHERKLSSAEDPLSPRYASDFLR